MYDYLEQVIADVRDYVEQEIDLTEWAGDRDGLEEKLNDDLWTCDNVTGNASGSYYCNAWKAEEALAHNWDLLAEALEEFGQDGTDVLKKGAEAMDVTIRCYLLGHICNVNLFRETLSDDSHDLRYNLMVLCIVQLNHCTGGRLTDCIDNLLTVKLLNRAVLLNYFHGV